jgi:phosphatidylserine decarboxylase
MQRPLDGEEETPDVSSDDAENSSTPVSTPGGATTETINAAKKSKRMRFKRMKRSGTDKSKEPSEDSGNNSSNAATSDSNPIERVINVKNCPLCHRPRLNSKAEIDIITHLAICASQDWNSVDRIVVGNFVTASQAQRKWYTKMITKVSSGDYKLGAVSCFFRAFLVSHSSIVCSPEFGEYHCTESDDGATRGGEDASVRAAWDSTLV